MPLHISFFDKVLVKLPFISQLLGTPLQIQLLLYRDYDSAVRILLDRLNDPENAVRIVKQTKSTEGAKMVAKFFQKLNDFSSAIQFLVISRFG